MYWLLYSLLSFSAYSSNPRLYRRTTRFYDWLRPFPKPTLESLCTNTYELSIIKIIHRVGIVIISHNLFYQLTMRHIQAVLRARQTLLQPFSRQK